jgi:hypothetical protein
LRLNVILDQRDSFAFLLGESDDTLQNWVFTCYPETFLVDPTQPSLTTTTIVGGVSNSNPLLSDYKKDPNTQSVTLLTDETCFTGSSTTPQPATSTCDACLAGTFKPHLGDEACGGACPSFSVSLEGSNELTDCQCEAGYSGPDGGACSACAAGSYKAIEGSAACTFCGVGFYSNATAAASVESCGACPGNSSSVAGSARIDQCDCNPGYRQTLDHDACIQCSPGYYDSALNRYECSQCAGGLYSAAVGATGNETCQPCSAGYYSEAGSADCDRCPANSNSPPASALITDCTCNPGATGSDGATCTACVAGKYKDTVGADTCTDCGAGTYSAVGGASLANTCTSCPANSQSSSASTVCVCMAGHTGPDDGPCVACVVGTYKGIAGTDACQACVTSKTTPAEQSVSVAQCVCKAGFGLPMTTPGTCPGGQFVPFTGTSTCSTCVNGKSLNESKLFEIESRVNSLFAPGPREFYSHAPFLYVEGMQCQTDLTGLYFLLKVQAFNSIPVYQKLVSATTDQENIGNSKVQIAYANGIWVVNDLRGYYRVALKSTQWSLCTGDGAREGRDVARLDKNKTVVRGFKMLFCKK